MSIKQFNRVWEESPYSDNMLLLHLALADVAADDGTGVRLAQDTMADKIRCSVSSIKRYLKQMTEDGIIEVHHQGGAFRGDPNHYRLVWPESGYSEDYGGHSSEPLPVDTESIKGVTAVDPIQVDTQSIKGFSCELQTSNTTTSNTKHTTIAGSKKPKSSKELLASRKTKTQPKAPAAPSSGAVKVAQELLRKRWDDEKASTGKDPLWSFPGVLKIVKEYLKGGHTEEDIEYLLDNAPVYTKAAFQMTLSSKDKPSTGGRAAVTEAISALDALGAKKSPQSPGISNQGDIIEVQEAMKGELT